MDNKGKEGSSFSLSFVESFLVHIQLSRLFRKWWSTETKRHTCMTKGNQSWFMKKLKTNITIFWANWPRRSKQNWIKY